MPDSLLAVRSTLFALSTLVFALRAFFDVSRHRRRAITLVAAAGWTCYAAAFGLQASPSSGDPTAEAILAPTALWTIKLSAALLLITELGVRVRVVVAIGAFLGMSWAAVVAARLALCRPWISRRLDCMSPAAMWSYAALDIAGYAVGAPPHPPPPLCPR